MSFLPVPLSAVWCVTSWNTDWRRGLASLFGSICRNPGSRTVCLICKARAPLIRSCLPCRERAVRSHARLICLLLIRSSTGWNRALHSILNLSCCARSHSVLSCSSGEGARQSPVSGTSRGALDTKCSRWPDFQVDLPPLCRFLFLIADQQ